MKVVLSVVMSLLFFVCFSQETSEYNLKKNKKGVDADLIFNYYSQDGNNSAVEGGIGSQALDNIGALTVVKVNLDSVKSIKASFGADFYSSASTDQIDNNVSSASSEDLRAYVNIGFEQKLLKSGQTLDFSLGGSSEYDYTSVNGGISYAKESKNGNSEFSASAKVFIDKWSLYIPSNARDADRMELFNNSTARNSYIVSAGFSQVLNPKTQFSLNAEYVLMDGLLSTPFHRVYFSNGVVGLERFPSQRTKIPISLRVNRWINDKLILRSFYRFYTDNFGINSHTLQFELPIRFNKDWTVMPFYRYHTQTESIYFGEFQTQSANLLYRTADYDLSSFTAQKVGISLLFYPLKPLVQFSKNGLMLESIQLRGGYYGIDYGLDAYFGSINFAFGWK